jgi:hypothetical protein
MKDGKDRTSNSTNSPEALGAERSSGLEGKRADDFIPPLRIEIDFDYYLGFLEDSDLTDHQKCELVRELFGIVNGFVALGFNVHPLQQAQQSCGETSASGADARRSRSNVVSSVPSHLINEFVRRSGKQSPCGEKGVADG